jgi:S-adenosylmethionine:tRNA ribosyltransferase-isomerase
VRVSEFDFALPEDLIAQTAAPRGESRLLVLGRASGTLTHARVRDLPQFLRPGDVLVANDSRVFPARLLGRRVPSGGAVECLLLSREDADLQLPASDPCPAFVMTPAGQPASNRQPPLAAQPPASSLAPPTHQVWSALVHPGQKLKPGAQVRFESDAGVLMAEILERQFFGRRRLRLWAEGDGQIDTLVDAMGHVPLPPYIHRSDTPVDRERYQTVFATARGSIAAPTAGLHFDAPLLDAIDRAGVERVTITLHVGYGTFKPVRAEEVADHVVDPETYDISEAAASSINAALDAGRRVVAIGTTTTRALEDAARRAAGRVRSGPARAEVFIHPGDPGFDFRVISGLLTNFHLPKSSLLMLVAAFAGREQVLAAYREAVEQRYRFYSYGDAMLVI